MRSTHRLTVAALCLLSVSSAAFSHAADATPPPARLPQAACAGWNRIGALTLEGSIELGGLKGAFTTTIDTRTGRYVLDRDYGVYSAAQGFDGREAWSRDLSGASHDLNSSSARAISATLAWLTRRGWCEPVTEGTSSTKLPDDPHAGIAESVWQVTPSGGSPVILRFDRSGGLPRSFEIHLPFNRLIRHFNDWRRVGDGILVAWAQSDEDPEDESLEKITVKSVELSGGSPPPAAKFTRPLLPADSLILDKGVSATVAYEDDGIGRIFVPVFIDGQGPFPFEVDTGGHLILTERTAAALHLNPTGSLSDTGGGSGVVHSGLVRTQEIRIGSAVILKQVAKVLPLREWSNDRGTHPPRAGILGLELFERFVVQLDRAHKTVTLTPIASFAGAPRGTALPIRFNEDAPLVNGTFGGIAGEFELDSGDAGPAIIEGYWAEQHGLHESLRRGVPWTGAGVGGEYGDVLTRGDFSLGPLKLSHEVVSYSGPTDSGSESTHMQAGLIGESTLRRFDMTYDYGHGLVWIDPDPKAPELPFNRAGLRVRRDTAESFVAAFVVPDSPAAAAGLKPGDRILAVNSQPASQLSAAAITLMFSAPVGSKLDLLVAFKGDGTTQSRSLRLAELLP